MMGRGRCSNTCHADETPEDRTQRRCRKKAFVSGQSHASCCFSDSLLSRISVRSWVTGRASCIRKPVGALVWFCPSLTVGFKTGDSRFFSLYSRAQNHSFQPRREVATCRPLCQVNVSSRPHTSLAGGNGTAQLSAAAAAAAHSSSKVQCSLDGMLLSCRTASAGSKQASLSNEASSNACKPLRPMLSC